jgi:acyl-CoA synthetase (AMP-forming)/AMP-acid ligase II
MRLAPPELIAQYRARGWWGDTTLDDLFRARVREFPGTEAVVDPPNRRELVHVGEPRRLTFAELDERVDRLCAALRAAGLDTGDVLLTQLPNIVEHVELYLAAARLGLVLSPLPMLARQHDIRHAAGMLAPRAFVTVSRFKDTDHAALAPEGVPVLTFCTSGEHASQSLDELPKLGAAPSWPRIDADDIYTICWTSGTESAPKAVPRSHNQWIAISWAHFEAADIRAGDRILNPFPLINMAAIGGCLTSWLHSGATLVLHHPLDLRVFLGQVARERITYTVVPPAVLNMLLKDEALAAQANLSSLRSIGSGSAPLSEWMIRGYRERFGIEIVNLFGSNEGVSLVSGPREMPDPAHRARYFPRFGRPDIHWGAKVAQMIETRLVDPDTGAEVTEPGVPAELVVRGPTVFSGYLGPEELTRSAFTPDGYFRTGDLFEIAGPGEQSRFYRYVGRCKQIIARGGMKISPDELDHLLAGHPDLAEAAAIGVPDEIMGERVCAVVVPKPGKTVTLESIASFLTAQGAAVYKIPERMAIVERLPRNAMGKVVRQELAVLVRGGT